MPEQVTEPSSVPLSPRVLTATSCANIESGTEDDCVDGIPARCRHVIRELIDTECSYVKALGSIIEGYRTPMLSNEHLPVKREDAEALFNNMEELYNFSQLLHRDMEKAASDMVALAECFLRNEDNFKMYTTYCTGYPQSVEVLSKAQRQSIVAEFLKGCQLALGQMLPLGAYLLKPVQRILKYHLLLADLLKQYGKRFGTDNKEFSQLEKAQQTMGSVANYINAMKRKHEASVRAQEIISQVVGWDTKKATGTLLHEASFRCVSRNGTHRIVYMFEKLLLLAKKNKEGIMVYKGHITYDKLTVAEGKDTLFFEVKSTEQKSLTLVLAARDEQQRSFWLYELRKLMLENHPSLPPHAKELMLKSLAAKDQCELFKNPVQMLSPASPSPVSPTPEPVFRERSAATMTLDWDVESDDNKPERRPSRGRTVHVDSTVTLARQNARKRASGKVERRDSSPFHDKPATVESDADVDDDEPDVVVGQSRKQRFTEERPEVLMPGSHNMNLSAPKKTETTYSAPMSTKVRRVQNASVCDRWNPQVTSNAMQNSSTGSPSTAVGSKEQIKHTVGLVSKLVKRYTELVELTDEMRDEEPSVPSSVPRLSPGIYPVAAASQKKDNRRLPGVYERRIAALIETRRSRQKETPANRSSHWQRRQSLSARPVTTMDAAVAAAPRLRRSASYAGCSDVLAGLTLPQTVGPAKSSSQAASRAYFSRESVKLSRKMSERRQSSTSGQRSGQRSRSGFSSSSGASGLGDYEGGGKVRSLIARFSVQPM